jgi:hypothetical protein
VHNCVLVKNASDCNVGVPYNTLRFKIDGEACNDEDTPKMVRSVDLHLIISFDCYYYLARA